MNKEVISHFREKPKTKLAWWSMGLGLSTLLVGPVLGINAAFINPYISSLSNQTIGLLVGLAIMAAALALSTTALIFGIRAYKSGERSWVMWLGFVPAIVIGGFWIFMIIGEFIFPH